MPVRRDICRRRPARSLTAAVLVRGDVNKAKHGFGIGPCGSCQALRDHYDIHFVTGGS